MIIKGKSRAGPGSLAAHLRNVEKNERVTVLETRGTVAQDLRGALIEMDAYAAGTRCEKPLYHAAISPAPPHLLTPEQRAEAIDALEQKLGFVGHARAVVIHEKLGREHIHVVWSRIDLDEMRAVSDSHNYRKHEEVSRDLERRFGHERVQGAHHERDGVDRPDRTPSRAELRQEERTGIKGKMVKEDITAAFQACDSPEAFRAALEEHGYTLAKGDRRDFVVIDWRGGIHSMARRIEGMKAAELREFMAPLDRDSLPSIDEAKEQISEREAARHEALREKDYSRGDDYVSQTSVALKDHLHQQKALDKEPRPTRPLAPEDAAPEIDISAVWKEDEERKRRDEIEAREHAQQGSSSRTPREAKFDNVEMTEAQRARMERLLGSGEDLERDNERAEDDPDRQREAPGGGRTRSR